MTRPWLLLALAGLISAACGSSTSPAEAAGDCFTTIRFEDRTYFADFLDPGTIDETQLGDSLGEVAETLPCRDTGPGANGLAEPGEGIASLGLPLGTEIRAFAGSDSRSVLVAMAAGGPMVFRGYDRDPFALDGTVVAVGINDGDDGLTRLATINDEAQVSWLVDQLSAAPVITEHVSSEGRRFFLALELSNGLTVNLAYFLDVGVLVSTSPATDGQRIVGSAWADAIEGAIG